MTDRLAELLDLLQPLHPLPWQLRRIAELTELLYDEEAAQIWWQAAAAHGDQAAQLMLEADHDTDLTHTEERLRQAAAHLRHLTEKDTTP